MIRDWIVGVKFLDVPNAISQRGCAPGICTTGSKQAASTLNALPPAA